MSQPIACRPRRAASTRVVPETGHRIKNDIVCDCERFDEKLWELRRKFGRERNATHA